MLQINLKNAFIHILLGFALVFFAMVFQHCASHKKNVFSKVYHNTTAHYNTYFIAREEMIQVENANELYAYLLQKGIVVRNRSNQYGCDECLRVTVGTEAENLQLVEAIRAYQKMITTVIK